ncbi:hypothetical protein ScPMuIL_012158 [Solemya velum]
MLDLHTVKEDFSVLMVQVQPWTLAQFVMWLDLKVAEYKVNGVMDLDDFREKDHLHHYSGVLTRSCPCKRPRHSPKDHGGNLLCEKHVKMKRPRLETRVNSTSHNSSHGNLQAKTLFQGDNSSLTLIGEEEDSEMYLMLKDHDSDMTGSKNQLDVDHNAVCRTKQKKHSNDNDSVIINSQSDEHPLNRQHSLSSSKHCFDTDNSVSNCDLSKSPKETCHIKSEPVFGSPCSGMLSSEAVDYSGLVSTSSYTGVCVNEKSNDSQVLSPTPPESNTDKSGKDQTQHAFPVSLFTVSKLQNRLSQCSYGSDSNDVYDLVSSGEIPASGTSRNSPPRRQETGNFKQSLLCKSTGEKSLGNTDQEAQKKQKEDFNLEHSDNSSFFVTKERDSSYYGDLSSLQIKSLAELPQYPICSCEITLPTFSDPLVSQMLRLGITHRYVLSKVLNHCAEHMLTNGFLHKHDYQRFSEMFYKQYPAIGVNRAGFQYPWSVFAKSLSQKIRTTRWKLKKMEAEVKIDNTKTQIMENGEMFLETNDRVDDQS